MKTVAGEFIIEKRPPLFDGDKYVLDASGKRHNLVPSRYIGQPLTDRLPHIKRAKAKGNYYYYFTPDKKSFTRLPDIEDDGFAWAYQCELAKKAGRPIPAVRRRDYGYVYFITAGDVAVKIGYAMQPESRLQALQPGHHLELKIAALIAGGQPLEREYHQRFKQHRLRSEWFALHPEIVAEIEAIQASSQQEQSND